MEKSPSVELLPYAPIACSYRCRSVEQPTEIEWSICFKARGEERPSQALTGVWTVVQTPPRGRGFQTRNKIFVGTLVVKRQPQALERRRMQRFAHEPEVRTFCAVLAFVGWRLSKTLDLTAVDRKNIANGVLVFESLKKWRRGEISWRPRSAGTPGYRQPPPQRISLFARALHCSSRHRRPLSSNKSETGDALALTRASAVYSDRRDC